MQDKQTFIKKKIDIIIPVYYTFDTAVRCIKAVLDTTTALNNLDIRIIVVDDSGNKNANEYFSNFIKKAQLFDKVEMITLKNNLGFIGACYAGIEYRKSDFKLLLNSDTIVTGDWLDHMINIAESDDKIALVNPVTNNASNLGISIPDGYNINSISEYLSHDHGYKNKYIDLITVVGFCLLIKTKYIDKYGFIDKIYDKGYCEESDLHLRYLTQGLRGVLAPNAFVYHVGEKSFGSTNREEYMLNNSKILKSRYGSVLDTNAPIFNKKTVLKEIKQDLLANKNKINAKTLFFTPHGNLSSGGVEIMSKYCNDFNTLGIPALMVVTEKGETKINSGEDRTYSIIQFKELKEYKNLRPEYIFYTLDNDAYQICEYVTHLEETYMYRPKIIRVLQDIEGWFEGHRLDVFEHTLGIADLIICVSEFLLDYLKSNFPKSFERSILIENPINNDILNEYFKKSKINQSNKNFDVVCMTRNDQKRGSIIFQKALKVIDNKGIKLKVAIFGGYKILDKFNNIEIADYGQIPREEVSNILTQSRIFIEASFYQGFGLTSYEAYFNGCSIIASSNYSNLTLKDKFKEKITFFEIGNSDKLAEEIIKIKNQNLSSETINFNLALEISYYNTRLKDTLFKIITNIKTQKYNEEFYKYCTLALMKLRGSIEYLDYSTPIRYKIADRMMSKFEQNQKIYKIISRNWLRIKKILNIKN